MLISWPGSTGSARSTGRGAHPSELLAELRGLLEAAEAARETRRGEGEEVVERLRTALARDIIGGDRALGRRRQDEAEVGHLGAAGATSAWARGRRPSASTGSRSIRASGRPLTTGTRARRRSSTSSRAPGCACRTMPRSPCGPATASCTRLRQAHSLRADADGLDVLVFGTRVANRGGNLPRAGVAWIGGSWTDVGGGGHPWKREVGGRRAGGAGARRAARERRQPRRRRGQLRGQVAPARAGCRRGAERPQLGTSRPRRRGRAAALPLRGGGDLRRARGRGRPRALADAAAARDGLEYEEHAIRAGHVVSRPAGTGIAHGLRASEPGMTYLAYGTRGPRTRATTFVPTRSTSAGWASSPGSRIWTSTTGSRNN